jgi:hypothetical protein
MIEEEQDLLRNQVNSENPWVNLSGCRGFVAHSSRTTALTFFLESVVFTVLNFRFRIVPVDMLDECEVLHGPRSEAAAELARNTYQATA